MGSTGEPDQKRRQLGSLSPTPALAATKKRPLWSSSSEDKKLDAAVLQFQNQKLTQKLEAQKVEYAALENTFSELKHKQQPYDSVIKVVHNSWEKLVNGLESCSIRMRESSNGEGLRYILSKEDEPSSLPEDAFLSRLVETGATDSSSSNSRPGQLNEGGGTGSEKCNNTLRNLVETINELWHVKDGLRATILKELAESGSCRHKASTELESEVRSLRQALSGLHLKHKAISGELQTDQDAGAKSVAELRQLRGDVESAVAELKDSNCKLAALKAEKDATKGAFFPVLHIGNKHVLGEKVRDKQRDIQDMELALKELSDQAMDRLAELKCLHEERIKILEQLTSLQTKLKSVKSVSSSQAYLLVRDQLEKSKAEVLQYQALLEKLQVEKHNLVWREREVTLKTDLLDVSRRSSGVTDSRVAYLEKEIQKQIDERSRIETKLEEALREPGRKEIIAEFKALVSSFPKKMSSMQTQLSKYKEAAVEIHSMRAEVQSLSSILDRKAQECKTLSSRSADQHSKIQKLEIVVQDLKDSDMELNLIVDMYRRESTDPGEVDEAKYMEYKAWAHVQSLKSSLDEQNLELRVKIANEAEAVSQRTLAAAEAEIAELRRSVEASKRDVARLSEIVKSKNEDNETYLSEIETIGQAYDDMQTQNQQLLQQITERDDYNIKLVLEGLKARQMKDALIMDKRNIDKEIQQGNASVEFLSTKASRIEDQLRFCSDQVQRLTEDRHQNSITMESMQKRLSEVRRTSDQARASLEESQSKVVESRSSYMEQQLELEKERFSRKRKEEESEVVRRKVSRLRLQIEGSSVLQKLRQELGEYKEILKCSTCLDRPKEVVITKCFHLFCNPCVQKILGSRHRKCPVCAASFGPNDVKPVYI